jgi:hypothetical protein
MPRYYFDVVCGSTCIRDECGHECFGLATAQLDAMRAAGELAREQLRKGKLQDIQVNVQDELLQPVLSVTVSMKLDRMNFAPEAL